MHPEILRQRCLSNSYVTAKNQRRLRLWSQHPTTLEQPVGGDQAGKLCFLFHSFSSIIFRARALGVQGLEWSMHQMCEEPIAFIEIIIILLIERIFEGFNILENSHKVQEKCYI